MENQNAHKDYNHDELGAFGLSGTCQELNDRIADLVKGIKEQKGGGRKTSELAEALEKNLTPREMATAMSFLIAEKAQKPCGLPSFEEFMEMLKKGR